MQTTAEERFWSKVKRGESNECWPFTSKANWGAYKAFWTGEKQDGAHRFSLELKIGRPLKPGECALHKCDNPLCVNPDHLFLGTNKDNSEDMVRKGRKEKGAAVFGSKLTDRAVLSMRRRYARGWTLLRVATRYGVTESNAFHIINGKTWKHVGGPIGTRPR